jgi:hypothetical protein
MFQCIRSTFFRFLSFLSFLSAIQNPTNEYLSAFDISAIESLTKLGDLSRNRLFFFGVAFDAIIRYLIAEKSRKKAKRTVAEKSPWSVEGLHWKPNIDCHISIIRSTFFDFFRFFRPSKTKHMNIFLGSIFLPSNH